ncbi:protein lin-9 homolog isoform X2 [Ruditapes philippinarum]|uniref:protein lin-9 homolog isoform X2 n=1 Tax=Ruditapes philippinarum TaxID=129788 RepID=UPI00295C017F|nr:protein lin-9 homolog isoform X2 [Ruditapes philippinarum]
MVIKNSYFTIRKYKTDLPEVNKHVGNSAKVLVSMKEGLNSPNKRGHPSRIRKRNMRFFNDDEDTSTSPAKSSPRKQSRTSSSRNYVSTGNDKRVAQIIGVRLRNLLKLPKAHKWVCYEWFYSNLDQPLFQGENDFQVCLKESFPQLKLKKMRRVEWSKIRRLMGKPRRCSSSFFEEERAALHTKRHKIRLLQQRKINEVGSHEDLPEEVPVHLVIGTKVTARLRRPQDGLFTGVVDALDTVHNTYRVTFDRPGLGTHSIPDYEVRSSEPVETIPLSAYQQKARPRNVQHRTHGSLMSPPRFIPNNFTSGYSLDNDPLLSGSPFKGQLMSIEGGTYGGFPIKFLVLVTRLSKILDIKKEWIKQLKEMNTEAEKRVHKSYQQPIPPEFQKKYANIVLELENLNKDLNEYLVGVQQYCHDIAPEQGLKPIDQPSEVKAKADSEAANLVNKITNNMFHNKRLAKNEPLMELIGKLTSLMLQIKTFSENELNSFEFKSLQDTLTEVRSKLDGNNINSFKNNVEIHINHVQSGLSQMGNLHAFSNTHFNVT